MLSLNFAETFAPDRQSLARLLMFIADNSDYASYDVISKMTGIPQGASSGKVAPFLKYLVGMGLIEKNEHNWYRLTTFGQAVYDIDLIFSEAVTAWACHAFMCDKAIGSPVYNEINKVMNPGEEYDRKYLDEKIIADLALPKETRCIGPAFGFYTNDSAFADFKIMTKEKNNTYIFNSSPVNLLFMPLYGAFICHWYNEFFFDAGQITIDEFNRVSGFGRIFGIKDYEVNNIFSKVAGMGYIRISNLVNPPVFSVTMNEDDAWRDIYINFD